MAPAALASEAGKEIEKFAQSLFLPHPTESHKFGSWLASYAINSCSMLFYNTSPQHAPILIVLLHFDIERFTQKGYVSTMRGGDHEIRIVKPRWVPHRNQGDKGGQEWAFAKACSCLAWPLGTACFIIAGRFGFHFGRHRPVV
jgi:hypothetical protein